MKKLKSTLIVAIAAVASFVAVGSARAEDLLPAGYTRLEWVAASGNSIIDTGYCPKSTDRIECEFNVAGVEQGAMVSLFASRVMNGSYQPNCYAFCPMDYSRRGSYIRSTAGTSTYTGSPFAFDVRESLVCDETGATWTYKDVSGAVQTGKAEITEVGGDCEISLAIFGRHLLNGQKEVFDQKLSAKLYSFKIFEKDAEDPVHDYVPCMDPNGVVGLYDLGGKGFLGPVAGSDPLSDPLHYDEGLFLSYIESTGTQYIDTGYCPKSTDRIECEFNTVRVEPSVTTYTLFSSQVMQSGVNQNCYAFYSMDWTRPGAYQRKTVTSTYTGSPFAYDVRESLVCDETGATWTYKDASGAVQTGTAKINEVGGDCEISLAIFCRHLKNNGNEAFDRNASAKLYSFKIFEKNGTTPLHDYVPFRQRTGRVGLLDTVDGRFYPNCGSGSFNAGVAYAVDGDTINVHDGSLTPDVIAGFAKVRKVSEGALDAGGVVAYPAALTIDEGVFSLGDGTASDIAVTGSLKIAGGTIIGIDVTESGSDRIVPGSLDLSAASEDNPIKISITGAAGLDVVGKSYVVISAGIDSAAVSKFQILNSNVPLRLAVDNGALVLKGKSEDLPAGYTRLEWVWALGNSIIDTGYCPKSTDRIECEFNVAGVEQGAMVSLFASRVMNGSYQPNCYAFCPMDYSRRGSYIRSTTGTSSYTGSPFAFDVRESLVCDETGATWTYKNASGAVQTGKAEITEVGGDCEISLAIFGRHLLNGQKEVFDQKLSAKLYSFKIFEKGAEDPVHDYVPCKDPNGVVGLYDLVGEEFLEPIAGSDPLHYDEGLFLSYIESTGTQYIDTGYCPKSTDRIECEFNTVRVEPSVTTYTLFSSQVTQSGVNQNCYAFYSMDWTRPGAYQRKTVTSTWTGSPFAYDVRESLVCDETGATWTYKDASGAVQTGTAAITEVSGDCEISLAIFCRHLRNNGNEAFDRNASAKLYSFKIFEKGGTAPIHDYVPFRQWTGKVGLLDTVDGRFLENCGSGSFNAGAAYAADGDTINVHDGSLTPDVIAGFAKVRKVSAGTLNAGGVATYPAALTIDEGEFSLKDGAASDIAVAGTLKIAGGTTIGIDITKSGCDRIVPDSLDLSAASKDNPIVIDLAVAEGLDVGARRYVLIQSGVTVDRGVFKLTGSTNPHVRLYVVNGALIYGQMGFLMTIR